MSEIVIIGAYISEIVIFCGLLSYLLVYSCIMLPKKGGNKPEKPNGGENSDNEGYELCGMGKLLANYYTLLICYLDTANMLPNLQIGQRVSSIFFYCGCFINMLLACCLYGANMLLQIHLGYCVGIFFYYGPFRNMLLMHCLYAANMLLQIYLGQRVGGIFFCAHNLMDTLPVWYVDAAHMLLITRSLVKS